MKKIAIAFSLMFYGIVPFVSADIIRGSVTDAAKNLPLDSVKVRNNTSSESTFTGLDGTYQLGLPVAILQSYQSHQKPGIVWNPETGLLSLYEYSGKVSIVVNNLQGVVMSHFFPMKSDLGYGTNLSHLSHGIYFVTVKTEKRNDAYKILYLRPGVNNSYTIFRKSGGGLASLGKSSASATNVLVYQKTGYLTATRIVVGSHDSVNVAMLSRQSSAGMKLIPAAKNSFQMGQMGIAEPVHQVTFTYDFWMDSTEVTQADYLTLMEVNPSHSIGNLSHPVENVAWFDVALYCNKRSKKDGMDTIYRYTSISGTPGDGCTLSNLQIEMTKNGYRLPTEAEWEYACRAGTTTRYYWDNGSAGDYSWYSDNSSITSHPIAQKQPNAFSLYDMCGNVFEWCNDWYGTYSGIAQSDPIGSQSGNSRVIRGGSWNNTINYLASANRQNPEVLRYNDGGFRCVRAR